MIKLIGNRSCPIFLPGTGECQSCKDQCVPIPGQRQRSIRLFGGFHWIVNIGLVQSAKDLPKGRSLLRPTLGCRLGGTPGELASLPDMTRCGFNVGLGCHKHIFNAWFPHTPRQLLLRRWKHRRAEKQSPG